MNYIEGNEDHFAPFMEDDEPFGDYIGRMRTCREWGGHQELYAASQCLRVNIFVHQVGAPRFILACDLATRDIHISYHGECHYNSVRKLDDVSEPGGAKPVQLGTALPSLALKQDTSVAAKVAKAVPWVSADQISQALNLVDDNAELAIEMLVANPEILEAISDIELADQAVEDSTSLATAGAQSTLRTSCDGDTASKSITATKKWPKGSQDKSTPVLSKKVPL